MVYSDKYITNNIETLFNNNCFTNNTISDEPKLPIFSKIDFFQNRKFLKDYLVENVEHNNILQQQDPRENDENDIEDQPESKNNTEEKAAKKAEDDDDSDSDKDEEEDDDDNDNEGGILMPIRDIIKKIFDTTVSKE